MLASIAWRKWRELSSAMEAMALESPVFVPRPSTRLRVSQEGEPNDEEILSLESDFRRRFLLFFEGLGFTGAGAGVVT